MKITTRLRNRGAANADENALQDDSPEQALKGEEEATSDPSTSGSSQSRRQKREERRARKRQQALDNQRRKQRQAAQIAEETYQIQGGAPKKGPLSSISASRLIPSRFRKSEGQDTETPPSDSELVAGMMGTEAGVINGDVSTSDGLEELLKRESGMKPQTSQRRSPQRTRRGASEQGPINEAGDRAAHTDDMPVRFDTGTSTKVEKSITGLVVAGMASLVVLGLVLALQIVGSGSEQASAVSSQELSADSALSPTQPAGRAAELAEGFANSYLAYPGPEEQATAEYVSSLESYLHPDADPDLFIPISSDETRPTEVKYASATSVKQSAGEDRYKVLVDARLREIPAEDSGGSSDSSGDSSDEEIMNQTLAVYVKVPESGSGAYVVAPPTTTETASDSETGMPGIYGYQNAESLEEGPLKNTLQNFFDALYAEEDSRPLVKEEMVEGATVGAFPQEQRSYAGIERAALYYRDNLEAAQDQGFRRVYDVEVYVEVLDQSTGRTTLDAWSLTVGEGEEGGYKIVSVN